METRIEKTVPMLRNKITWRDIAKQLDLTIITVNEWRKSGEPNKNATIDLAVDEMVEEMKENKEVK